MAVTPPFGVISVHDRPRSCLWRARIRFTIRSPIWPEVIGGNVAQADAIALDVLNRVDASQLSEVSESGCLREGTRLRRV